MAGKGCPVCSGNLPLSKELVNEKLEKSGRGIRQIGEYINALTKTDFQCDCDQIWQSTPNNIMRGSGCPSCASTASLSKEIINERLVESGRDIRQIGEYISRATKTDFQCKCGYVWKSTPGNIIIGHGCPVCADYCYNTGKPGWLYILIFNGFIKYGITNNLDQRLRQHKYNGEYTVALSKLYGDGNIALNWEKSIKIIFGGRFVTKEIMPDGHTETLSIDKLEALLDTVR